MSASPTSAAPQSKRPKPGDESSPQPQQQPSSTQQQPPTVDRIASCIPPTHSLPQDFSHSQLTLPSLFNVDIGPAFHTDGFHQPSNVSQYDSNPGLANLNSNRNPSDSSQQMDSGSSTTSDPDISDSNDEVSSSSTSGVVLNDAMFEQLSNLEVPLSADLIAFYRPQQASRSQPVQQALATQYKRKRRIKNEDDSHETAEDAAIDMKIFNAFAILDRLQAEAQLQARRAREQAELVRLLNMEQQLLTAQVQHLQQARQGPDGSQPRSLSVGQNSDPADTTTDDSVSQGTSDRDSDKT